MSETELRVTDGPVNVDLIDDTPSEGPIVLILQARSKELPFLWAGLDILTALYGNQRPVFINVTPNHTRMPNLESDDSLAQLMREHPQLTFYEAPEFLRSTGFTTVRLRNILEDERLSMADIDRVKLIIRSSPNVTGTELINLIIEHHFPEVPFLYQD